MSNELKQSQLNALKIIKRYSVAEYNNYMSANNNQERLLVLDRLRKKCLSYPEKYIGGKHQDNDGRLYTSVSVLYSMISL